MGKYTLPELPYAYDALEPHIDARTMEIHVVLNHQDKLQAFAFDTIAVGPVLHSFTTKPL